GAADDQAAAGAPGGAVVARRSRRAGRRDLPSPLAGAGARGRKGAAVAQRGHQLADVSSRTAVIAHLRGRILDKHPNRIVVDVNGVGYDVFVPLSTFYGLGDSGADVALRIHTHVRDDPLPLYGL